MGNDLFNKKQKIEICCGLDIIIPALSMGATSITHFWHQCFLGLIFTYAGIILIFVINTKKYTLAKQSNILTFKRAVIIDSLVTALGLAFLWTYLYFGTPYSENEIVFPFGAWIIAALLTLPSLKTNKKIAQFFSDASIDK